MDANESHDVHTVMDSAATGASDLVNYSLTPTVQTLGVTGKSALTAFTSFDDFYLVIGALGFSGNLLACIVFIGHEPLRKRIPNFFLINQSALDLFVGAMLIMTTCLLHVTAVRPDSIPGRVMCSVINSKVLFTAPLISSTWNLAAMSLERYAEIVHPIRHKLWISRPKIYLVCTVVWIVGFLYKSLSVFLTTAVINGTCSIGGMQSKLGRTVNSLSTFLVEFFCPFTVITICYVRMIQATRKMQFKTFGKTAGGRSKPTDQQQPQKQPVLMSPISKNIFKIMTIIVTVLVISLGPKQICLFLYAFSSTIIDSNGLMINIFVFISYANCCFNPIIYLFKYDEFQRGFRVVILRKKNFVSSIIATVGLQTKSTQDRVATD